MFNSLANDEMIRKLIPFFISNFFEKTKHSLNGFLLQLLGAGEFEKYFF